MTLAARVNTEALTPNYIRKTRALALDKKEGAGEMLAPSPSNLPRAAMAESPIALWVDSRQFEPEIKRSGSLKAFSFKGELLARTTAAATLFPPVNNEQANIYAPPLKSLSGGSFASMADMESLVS